MNPFSFTNYLNQDKVKAFLEEFFPRTADAEGTTMPWREEIKRDPIVELDTPITQGGQRNNNPGREWIPNIDMETSVDIPPGCYYPPLDEIDRAGVLPRPVERALVVVLKEPGKPDYSVSGVYPPILLLSTFGKILEVVRARSLLFWVKTYKLLPDTRFGGRPGRNTGQVLLVLMNAIDRESTGCDPK